MGMTEAPPRVSPIGRRLWWTSGEVLLWLNTVCQYRVPTKISGSGVLWCLMDTKKPSWTWPLDFHLVFWLNLKPTNTTSCTSSVSGNTHDFGQKDGPDVSQKDLSHLCFSMNNLQPREEWIQNETSWTLFFSLSTPDTWFFNWVPGNGIHSPTPWHPSTI